MCVFIVGRIFVAASISQLAARLSFLLLLAGGMPASSWRSHFQGGMYVLVEVLYADCGIVVQRSSDGREFLLDDFNFKARGLSEGDIATIIWRPYPRRLASECLMDGKVMHVFVQAAVLGHRWP